MSRIRLVNSSLGLLVSLINSSLRLLGIVSRIIILIGIIGVGWHSGDNGWLSINDLSGVVEGGVVERSSSDSGDNTSVLLATAAADTDQ